MFAELFEVSPAWSANFLLILARLSAALVVTPLFGARGVPPQTKIGLAVLLSLIVLPLQAEPLLVAPANLLVFASMVGSEVLVGLSIGVAILLIFQTIEAAGSLVGVQIGFGLGQVIDPLSGTQSGTFEQFYRIVVTLMFFAVNGHYLVIAGLMQTFEIVPPGTADLTLIAGDRVAPYFGALVVVALRVALPVMGALLLTDLILGLVGRTVPQMNVLVVGFPVKVGVGILALAASLPLATALIGTVLRETLLDVNGFLVP